MSDDKQDSKDVEAEKPLAVEEVPSKASHGLEDHELSLREQLMKNWPSQDWERR